MSLAFEWVARIFAVSLLMFLPGVGGQWLDTQWNTEFFALIGFAFGLCAGLGVLLVMVNVKNRKSNVSSTVASKDFDQDNGTSER